MRRLRACAALLVAASAASCSRGAFEVPAVSDVPVVEAARLGDIDLTAPGYGISVRRQGRLELEVNIEAEDAAKVREGQHCLAYVIPSTRTLSCSVSEVLRAASAETGQAIAWLRLEPDVAVLPGEFLFAQITTGVKRRALVVPDAAVMTKGGRAWVVRREGESRFSPVAVRSGASSGGLVEISSGLAPGDAVVVRGGIGYLYPEFKAAGEGDR